MEGEEAQLQEWVKLYGSRSARDRTNSLQGSGFPSALSCRPQWNSNTQGLKPTQWPPLGRRAGVGDGPRAELRCSMQPLLGVVLVPLYTGDLLVTHICRLHVEPRIAVGLCPIQFKFFFYI